MSSSNNNYTPYNATNMNNNINDSDTGVNNNNSIYNNAQNNINNSQPDFDNNSQNTFTDSNYTQSDENNLGINNQYYNNGNNQQSFFGNPNLYTLFSQNTSNNSSTGNSWNQNPLSRTFTIIITSIISIIILLTLVIPSYHMLSHMDGGHHNLSKVSKSLDNDDSSSNTNSNSDDDEDNESDAQKFKQAKKQKGDWDFTSIHPTHQDYVNEDPNLSRVKPWTMLHTTRIDNNHADGVALGMYKRLQGDYESSDEKMKIKGHHITIENINGDMNSNHAKLYVTGVYEDQHAGIILNGAELYYWNKHDHEESSIDDTLIANQQNNGIELVDNNPMVQSLSASSDNNNGSLPENNKYLASNLLDDTTDFHKVSQFDV